ncbi:MAG: alpha/beta hydrolase family protein [Gemmataceae bacterium]
MILLLCLLAPHDDALLKRRADELQAKFLAGATTLDGWNAKLPGLRREYLDMLGLWPLPPRTPLKAAVTGTLTHDAVVIEKLHYQSRPGLYVTANLYRPADAAGKKLPAILYVCGHTGRGRDGNKTAFQDHGLWFARNGYVCLVVDTLQLGEVKGVHHGTYNLGRFHWLSLAYTPAGVECWNGVRGIDYLVSRPDVDAGRIGVTGISGGGATTVWVAAADDRVKVAVPVSGMSDLKSYVGDKVIDGHCDCMFLVNFRAWEWTTIAALIAPRPMLFANSDSDRIFPMDGNRRIIARLREAYKLHGKPDLVDEHVSVGGHDYRPDLRLAIFRFINKHLKEDTSPIADAKSEELKGAELRVFPADGDLPKDALNATIDETFIRAARPRVPADAEFAIWQRGMLARLREGPFFGFPVRVAGATGAERVRSEEGVPTLVVTDGEGWDWAKPHLGKGDVWTLALPSTPHKQPNYAERAPALVGETVDRRRVERIAGVVRTLGKVRVVGRGQHAVLAAYAGLFEPGVVEVVAVEPTATHRDGPHFLGVLRALDVPTALGMLAPRKLTLVGAKDKRFDHTAALYKAAGAADRLGR